MRKPATLHYGDTLPSATEFEEGDMFYLRPAGELYIRSGGAWALSASGAMLTSVQNDGSGVELVSDTGTSHTAKVRTITTTGNGISPAVSSGGGEVELSFDKVAAGWGAANGFATLDGSTKVVERLSYEGIASGVATLDASTKVVERLSYEGVANGVGTLDANAFIKEFPQVPDIATLRAIDGSSLRVLYVRGYSNDGDGGGGFFYRDATDTTSSDNGGTIIVDAGGNRWKRNLAGEINVKWFGATGDGTTDDTTALQNAFDAAWSAGIKRVYIPAGTYLCSNVIYYSETTYYGDGSDKTVFQSNGNAPVLSHAAYEQYNSVTVPTGDLTLRGFQVNGQSSSANTSEVGIVALDYYSRVEDVWVTNCGSHGIFFTHKDKNGTVVALSTLVNNSFSNISVINNYGYGLYIGENNNGKLTDVHVQDVYARCVDNTSVTGVYIGSGAGAQLVNIHVYGIPLYDGIILSNGYNVTMSNIYVENGTRSAIYLPELQKHAMLSSLNIASTGGSGVYVTTDASAINPVVIINGISVHNKSASTGLTSFNAGAGTSIKVYGYTSMTDGGAITDSAGTVTIS